MSTDFFDINKKHKKSHDPHHFYKQQKISLIPKISDKTTYTQKKNFHFLSTLLTLLTEHTQWNHFHHK